MFCLSIGGQGRLPRNSLASRGNEFLRIAATFWNTVWMLDDFCRLFVFASAQPETRLRHLSPEVSLPLLSWGLSLGTRRVGLVQIRLELSRRALVTFNGFEAVQWHAPEFCTVFAGSLIAAFIPSATEVYRSPSVWTVETALKLHYLL